MFHGRSAWSNRLSIRASTVVDHQLKRWSRWQGAVVCRVLLPLDLLEEKLPPGRLSGLPGQAFHRGLALAFAALVAPMSMVKPDQIEGRLGDLSFATRARGAHKTIDHLDQ